MLARPSDADTSLPGRLLVARKNWALMLFFSSMCVMVVSHWLVVAEAGDFGDAGSCRMIGARKREAGTTEN